MRTINKRNIDEIGLENLIMILESQGCKVYIRKECYNPLLTYLKKGCIFWIQIEDDGTCVVCESQQDRDENSLEEALKSKITEIQ